MADVSIDATISTSTGRGRPSLVFTTALIGYQFFIDADNDFSYTKTTDGGATWGTAVQISTDDTDLAFAVWYDQWTPGDTGTKIHMWWFGTTLNDALYNSLDTSGDTLGTETKVFNGASAIADPGNFISGTKTRTGRLYCAYDLDVGAEVGLHVSTDSGATWGASLSATFVEATLDFCHLFPASNTGDNDDVWAVYHDASANALTLKMWDVSGAVAVESATIQTSIDTGTDITRSGAYSASVRHSDGHLIIASCSDFVTATADLDVFDVTGTGTFSSLTTITTDNDATHYPSVFINQTTNDIYVAYLGKRDSSETSSLWKAYYTKSTDSGSTWTSGDTAYMEGSTGPLRQTWAPLMGLRFYVSWRSAGTLSGNAVNALTFSSGVNATFGVSEAADSLSSSGAVTGSGVSSVSATFTVTEASDSALGGAISSVSATFGKTEASDTALGTSISSVSATFGKTEAADSLSSSATVTNSGINIAVNVAETADSVSSGALVTGGGISPTVSITEASDSLFSGASTDLTEWNDSSDGTSTWTEVLSGTTVWQNPSGGTTVWTNH